MGKTSMQRKPAGVIQETVEYDIEIRNGAGNTSPEHSFIANFFAENHFTDGGAQGDLCDGIQFTRRLQWGWNVS